MSTFSNRPLVCKCGESMVIISPAVDLHGFSCMDLWGCPSCEIDKLNLSLIKAQDEVKSVMTSIAYFTTMKRKTHETIR
ncbi:hypothetical protein LCGC14_0547140 [marine sediment metagenome]|uniref:Uncharacterized protein n=1 Tax=marine sediment metagenome TaxID=412755 RepID=A0A0F9S9H6_9ZZZZ